MNLIFLGAPGAGKGTQAGILAGKLGLPHVSSGDLFREAIANQTELGLAAKSYMDKGELVPDDIVTKMIMRRISNLDCAKGFILDGFPRTLEQAETLDAELAKEGKTIDKAVCIKVSNKELIRRLTGRFICRNCQAPYHVHSNPSSKGDICEKCGGELYQRPDDSREVAENRLKVYFERTEPVIEYYRKTGILVEVNGEQSVDQVGEDLIEAIEKPARL